MEKGSRLLNGDAEKTENGMEGDSKGGQSSKKEGFFRADKIDLKNLDAQLERHLSKVWTLEKEANRPKEDWEIDLKQLVLKGKIAQGAFGSVYRGVLDGQDVAVKLLDWGEEQTKSEAEVAALRSAFRQEVAVWHTLDHRNVTKFLGASMGSSDLNVNPNSAEGSIEGPPNACCVVVEYLAGGTLKTYLIKNRRKKLAFDVVIQLALDLSRGLSYLQSKKIVHRDVKTENMLLDKNRTLKIADFGVARVEAQNPKDMTGETGTLGYMAPEVLDGKPYNRKCDVYSFGICLWEIYCCEMPYADLSFADMTSAVVKQNLRPEIPRCCPSALANVMKRCWDANTNGVQLMDGTMWMHHPRTHKMKQLLGNPDLFGNLNSVHCNFTVSALADFFQNNIRVKPDMDALGALGDAGWYCIRAILWANDYQMPQSVTALPGCVVNDAGVILACGATFLWQDGRVATFSCSFLSDMSMDLIVNGSKGVLRLHDFVIPYEEDSASYFSTSNVKLTQLHTGWDSKPSENLVMTELPQESLMIQEFARLVKSVRDSGGKPDSQWPAITRKTQVLLNAVNTSIQEGLLSVTL